MIVRNIQHTNNSDTYDNFYEKMTSNEKGEFLLLCMIFSNRFILFFLSAKYSLVIGYKDTVYVDIGHQYLCNCFAISDRKYLQSSIIPNYCCKVFHLATDMASLLA